MKREKVERRVTANHNREKRNRHISATQIKFTKTEEHLDEIIKVFSVYPKILRLNIVMTHEKSPIYFFLQ
jgi:hypothetical protein